MVEPEDDGARGPWSAVTQGGAFMKGAAAVLTTPGAYILVFGMLGFGALTRDLGFSLPEAAFITGAMFQLPGMVAFADELARSGSIAVTALAVVLTAVRLLPMTVVLQPFLRGSGWPRWSQFAAAHFIAITSWVEALRRLPELPDRLRLPFYVGFGLTLCTSTLVATCVGHETAGAVPPVVTGMLLFLTPVYFMTSLISTVHGICDKLALAAGTAIGPVFYLTMPGFDLLATGLIAGTGAYLVERAVRRRRGQGQNGDKVCVADHDDHDDDGTKEGP